MLKFLILTLLTSASLQAVTVQEVEKFLNGIQTFQADFTQLNGDGTQAQGVFYLKRPHNLKFVYTAPEGSVLLAKNGYLIFYDADQQEEMTLEVENTPAAFLLRDTLSLTENLQVKEIHQTDAQINVTVSDLEETVTLTLYFDLALEKLLGWRVKDIQNTLTSVQFKNPLINPGLSDDLFLRVKKFQSKRRRL